MAAETFTCPRCGTTLATLDRPCPSCLMGFVDYSQPCPNCGQPFIVGDRISLLAPSGQQHTLACPGAVIRYVRKGEPPVLCPLCGGKRHWKMAAASREQCLWRQWARDTERLDGEGWDAGVPERTPMNEKLYQKWLAENPEREGGSVPAERILRQLAREGRA
jgi:hypothetical protein